MARPSTFTQELGTALCDVVRQGMYVEVAAKTVGVPKSTLYRWLEQGEAADDGPLAEFWDAYQKAEGEAELTLYNAIGPFEQWQSLAWKLERRFRARWRRDIPDDSAAQAAPPQVVVVQVDRDARVSVQQAPTEQPK